MLQNGKVHRDWCSLGEDKYPKRVKDAGANIPKADVVRRTNSVSLGQ